MKKTFQTSKESITEVIYNQKEKKMTLKRWSLKENSEKIFVNWATYATKFDFDDFYNCTLKDIETLTSSYVTRIYPRYPNPKKHISKFNIY